MQAYGDLLLDWHYFPDSPRPDYYVRQLGTGKDRWRYPPSILNHSLCTPGIARGPWPGRVRRPAIGSLLRPISAAKMHSIKQLPIFPPPTPTRTKATLLASRRPQLLVTFRCNGDYERPASATGNQPITPEKGFGRIIATSQFGDGRQWCMKLGGMTPSWTGDPSTSCWRQSFGPRRRGPSG